MVATTPLLLEDVPPPLLLLPLLEEVTPLLLPLPLDEPVKPLELPLMPLLLPLPLLLAVASGTPLSGAPLDELHRINANGVASATLNPSIHVLRRIIDVLLGAVCGATSPFDEHILTDEYRLE